MKAHIYKRENYDADVKVLDINLVSKEECELMKHPRFYREPGIFYVYAVITFSDLDLPVGSDVWFFNPEVPSHWYIFEKNRGIYRIPFKADKYTVDEIKLKLLIREWAQSVGIEFG